MERDYLVLQLYGALSSWGEIAVGEQRSTSNRPSKSAVLGLVAASLGIERSKHEKLTSLYTGFSFASRSRTGESVLADFHTAQSAPAPSLKKKRVETRADALRIAAEKTGTMLSRREYLMDAVARVTIWPKSGASYSLEDVQQALRFPVYALYLGRRCCPLGLPLSPQILRAESPTEALRIAKFPQIEGVPGVGGEKNKRYLYCWEGGTHDLSNVRTVARRDGAVRHGAWQFEPRQEHQAMGE